MRIFGMSVWECLKEYTASGAGRLYDSEKRDVWYRIRDYAMHEFGRFVENVIDDALEEHLRIRVRVLVRVPEGILFPNPDYLSTQNPADPSSVQVIAIRVQAANNEFAEFGYHIPVPSIDIFDSPRYLNDWVTRITRYALDHIRPVAARPGTISWDFGRGESFAEYLYRSVPRGWPDTTRLPENEKAKALLLAHCTDEQIEQYKRNDWFIVVGGETGTCYRVRRESQINIDVMNGDRVEYKLCTVNDPEYEVPIEDQLLAQKTMIELNEAEFLETAIRW